MQEPFNALGLSHHMMKDHIKKGALCIDATCGRGRDSAFLAELVGEHGTVIALDIQKEAVASTKALADQLGLKQIEVFHSCHSRIDDFAKAESVDGIMFNFGWLPGGDHNTFSRTETSIEAVKKSLLLLKKDGIMTLCLYYGKENGNNERDDLVAFARDLDQMKYSVLFFDFLNRKNNPPQLILIKKEQSVL